MIKIVILHVIKCIEWASQSTFLLLINIFFSPAYLCFIYIEFIFVWRLFSITAKVRGGAVRLLKNNCLRGAYARLFSSRDFRATRFTCQIKVVDVRPKLGLPFQVARFC
jgi:hypothetical protein